MGNILRKIWDNRWALRSLGRSVYFNLRCLPLRQALRLPILLYKPRFRSLKGKIVINGSVKTGMITLGRNQVPLYPNTGITIECRGSITFGGFCCIGNASSLSVAPTGHLDFGEGFVSAAALKIAAYDHVEFGRNCRLGWDCTVIDTDFHALTRPDGSLSRGYAPIVIDEGCWLGTGCLVQKGTRLAPHTTVQARTVLSADYTHFGPCNVIGETRTIAVKASDTYRDMDNDEITYASTSR